MNTQNNLTVGDAGSMLLGAGLTQVTTNLNIGLILIGVGVFLKVLVAVLNRYNIPVSAAPLG